MTTVERLTRLRTEQERLYAAQATLNEQIVHNLVLIQRGSLLEIADANPAIDSFSFDANYEYDDEGGYYWSCSIFAHNAEGTDLGAESGNDELSDTLTEAEHDGNEESTPRAFESNSRWEGSITVERLRELWGDA